MLVPHLEDFVPCEFAQLQIMWMIVSFILYQLLLYFPELSNIDRELMNKFFTAPGFCPARNFTSQSGTRFVWQTTPAGTNATFTCPNNPSFSVSRNCLSCSGAGVWLEYDRRGCGTLTADLGGILSLVSVSYER